MTSKLRLAAATVTAALALGVAAPMANAVEASRTPVVSAAQFEAVTNPAQVNAAITAALASQRGEAVTGRSAVNPDLLEAAKYIVAYIKKYLAKEYGKAKPTNPSWKSPPTKSTPRSPQPPPASS